MSEWNDFPVADKVIICDYGCVWVYENDESIFLLNKRGETHYKMRDLPTNFHNLIWRAPYGFSMHFGPQPGGA